MDRFERGEEQSLAALRELKQLTKEMKDALLHRKLDEFGGLLHEEWEHKKRMSDRISNPSLDDALRRRT